jgi:hypothetical protein
MTANPSIDPARFLHEQLASASPDLLRQMLATFIGALMGAEADAICGAPYGVASPERSNSRNGYRTVTSIPGPAPWMWRSRSCAGAATSRTGCWNVAAAPSGR